MDEKPDLTGDALMKKFLAAAKAYAAARLTRGGEWASRFSEVFMDNVPSRLFDERVNPAFVPAPVLSQPDSVQHIMRAIKRGSSNYAISAIVKDHDEGRQDINATCAFFCKAVEVFVRQGKNISPLLQALPERLIQPVFAAPEAEERLLKTAHFIAKRPQGALENLFKLLVAVKKNQGPQGTTADKIKSVGSALAVEQRKKMEAGLDGVHDADTLRKACYEAFDAIDNIQLFCGRDDLISYAHRCMNAEKSASLSATELFKHRTSCILFFSDHIDPVEFVSDEMHRDLLCQYIADPGIEAHVLPHKIGKIRENAQNLHHAAGAYQRGYEALCTKIRDPLRCQNYDQLDDSIGNFKDKHAFLSPVVTLPAFDADVLFADYARQRVNAGDAREAVKTIYKRSSSETFWQNLDVPFFHDLAAALRQDNEKSAIAWLAHELVAKGHAAGEEIKAIHDAMPDNIAEAQDLLTMAAPIVSSIDDKKAQAMVGALLNAPHAAVARAQADALHYIWEALEEADPNITPMDSDGRADIPFSVEKMHALYMDVSRYLNVVQLQAPIIVSDDISAGFFLKKVFDGMPWMAHEGRCASEIFVGGSHSSYVYDQENIRDMQSAFGFLSMKKKEGVTIDDSQAGAEKLIALPVITIDNAIMKRTMDNGGEDILRAFQEMMAIFNHDYFHHQTARNLVPYFNGYFINDSNKLDRDGTPYASMLGKPKKLSATDPEDGNIYISYGAEQSYRFDKEKYVAGDPRWINFGKAQPYEFHALHIQNVLYRNYLDKGETGDKMRALVSRYVDGVAEMAGRAAENGSDRCAVNQMKMYYANMLAFHLLRVVPYGHPLMQHAEACIDELDIDADFRQEQMRYRHESWEERERFKSKPRTIENMAEMTGLSLEKLADRGKMTVAESVQLCAYFCAERIINPIYLEKYKEPQSYALPALRQMLSVVQRDMAMIKHRGGLEAYEKRKGAAKDTPRPV